MINTVSEQICLFLFEIKPIVHCPVFLGTLHYYHISYINAKYIQAVVIFDDFDHYYDLNIAL